jgi:hypothetical protein
MRCWKCGTVLEHHQRALEDARRLEQERAEAARRCECGHSDEKHVECVDFTSATGCFEEDCNCQRYKPPASR